MAATHRLGFVKVFAATLISASSLSLSGCQNFFICQKSSCTSTGSGSNGSGDYAYVTNSASGSTFLDGFDISAGQLTPLSGFPVNLQFTPSAIAIKPGNGYLYAAASVSSAASAGSIFGYTIGGAGNLNILSGGTAQAAPLTGVSAMDISPDGNYLFALDATGAVLYEYQIASTGLLTPIKSFSISSAVGTLSPAAVKVSPNENFVVCSLGSAGAVFFPYTSSGGITSPTFSSLNPPSEAEFGIAIDASNNVYFAQNSTANGASGVGVYAVNASSSASGVAPSASSINEPTLTFGSSAHPIALSSNTNGNLYIGNTTSNNISAYTNSSGVLANISGAPFNGPAGINSLAIDNSGKYIVAAGENTSTGIQIFTISSAGGLTVNASTGSGTSEAVVATTH